MLSETRWSSTRPVRSTIQKEKLVSPASKYKTMTLPVNRRDQPDDEIPTRCRLQIYSICPVGATAQAGRSPFYTNIDVSSKEEWESPVKLTRPIPADFNEHVIVRID
jgi:hypothetical protein